MKRPDHEFAESGKGTKNEVLCRRETKSQCLANCQHGNFLVIDPSTFRCRFRIGVSGIENTALMNAD